MRFERTPGPKPVYTIHCDNEQQAEHLMFMLDAFKIYVERSGPYQQSWESYGFNGAAFFLKDRANRVWRSCQNTRNFKREDALDAINSAVFAIRSQMRENFGGEFWPDDD